MCMDDPHMAKLEAPFAWHFRLLRKRFRYENHPSASFRR